MGEGEKYAFFRWSWWGRLWRWDVSVARQDWQWKDSGVEGGKLPIFHHVSPIPELNIDRRLYKYAS